MNGFLVITRGRTGSSALVDVLNKHPGIACYQEVFRPIDAKVPAGNASPIPFASFHAPPTRCFGLIKTSRVSEYLRYLGRASRADGKKLFGFKLLENHIYDWADEDIPRYVARHRLSVLFLKRKDLFRQAVSMRMAARRGAFNLTRSRATNPRVQSALASHKKDLTEGVHLDPEILLSEVIAAERANARIKKLISRHSLRSVDVFYEDFLSDRERCLGEIMRFLGSHGENRDSADDFIKMLPHDLSFIRNLDEIYSYFRSVDCHHHIKV